VALARRFQRGFALYCHCPRRYKNLLIRTFVGVRPYLYHLTDQENLAHIRETGRLMCAAILMEHCGRIDLLRMRRPQHVPLEFENRQILIRDQAALHRGHLKLADGYPFEDFLESLNRRIFFWPGNSAGPIKPAIRYFERYKDERPVILRIAVQSLLRMNPGTSPRFSAYNSGSPRCANGVRSPRGPATFQPGEEFRGGPSRVVEVSFDDSITIPTDTQIGTHPSGPWTLLNKSYSLTIRDA